jgi:hypothetical protein
MTAAEWQASAEPLAMIGWLAAQGHGEPLWQFTVRCCRRIWDDLPGDVFRRVVEHAERVGTRYIDDELAEVTRSLERLERQSRRATDDDEQMRLNRQIGFGRMVLACEHQDGAETAESIRRDLLEWAEDPEAERRTQADLLRQLVPDPC